MSSRQSAVHQCCTQLQASTWCSHDHAAGSRGLSLSACMHQQFLAADHLSLLAKHLTEPRSGQDVSSALLAGTDARPSSLSAQLSKFRALPAGLGLAESLRGERRMWCTTLPPGRRPRSMSPCASLRARPHPLTPSCTCSKAWGARSRPPRLWPATTMPAATSPPCRCPLLGTALELQGRGSKHRPISGSGV